MGIYKRKQESEKTRKHDFDQESNQERKKRKKERKDDQKSNKEKKIKQKSFFLDRFLGREHVLFLFSVTQKLTYFLIFFYKFSPLWQGKQEL